MGVFKETFLSLLDQLTGLGARDAGDHKPLPTDDELVALAKEIDRSTDGQDRDVIEEVDALILSCLRDAYDQGRQPRRVDMEAIVEELLRLGVPAYVTDSSGGTATLYAGGETTRLDGERGWPVSAGPGSFDWPGHIGAYAHADDFTIGLTDHEGPDQDVRMPDFATPAQYAQIIAGVVREAQTRDQRINDAFAAARAAFWATMARRFPEVRSGDFPPDATAAFEAATTEPARLWLYLNTPLSGLRIRRPAAEFEPRYTLIDHARLGALALHDNGGDLVCAELDAAGLPVWSDSTLADPRGLTDEQWGWCGRVADHLRDIADNPFDE